MDFTQAFHSGDPINPTLFCEQPSEMLLWSDRRTTFLVHAYPTCIS